MKSFWSRRDFLFQSGGGVSGVALAWLLDQQGMLAADRAVSSGACEAKASGPTPFLAKKRCGNIRGSRLREKAR